MKSRNRIGIRSLIISSLTILLALPLVCAAQEKIIFTSNGDIYSMRPDGTLPTQLTTDPAFDWHPSASSDGSRIVFASLRDFGSFSNEEIYIMNADGSGQTRLTDDFTDDREPAISPDGNRVVFLSNRTGPYMIWLMNADGTNPIPLTFGFDPSFSPDGTRIIYAAYDGVDYEIFTIKTDGTNRTQITQNDAGDGFPKFSPDGTRIAFASDRDGDTAVYIMNADGTAQTRLAGTLNSLFNDGNELSFSPDGTRIAFSSRTNGNSEVFSVGINGSNLTPITNSPAFDMQPWWSGPVYTPPVFDPPSDLRAEYIGTNFVNLRWNDNSNSETGFVVEQCRNKNCTNTIQMGQVGANVTTFLVTPLLANTQYTFRVTAVNAASGYTDYSNSLMVKTLRK